MLKLILALLPLAANVTGQQPVSKTSKAAVVKPAAPPPSTIQGIPAGAVKLDENTYRYEEKDASGKLGKVWLFRRNPFGVSKIEEKEAAKIGQVMPAADIPATATDLGDSYRFERPTPFGAKVWTRKKSELTEEERAIAARNATSVQKATN